MYLPAEATVFIFTLCCCVNVNGDAGLNIVELIFGPGLGNVPERSRKNNLNSAETLVRSYGYPFEAHEVISESGYILSLHRIPHGIKNGRNKTRRAVLFLHGLWAATDCWLFRGPVNDMPYILADAGYDVWLGNMRGNFYSKAHQTLDADYDEEYWQFSLHEVAFYDIPATIDYILNCTKQDSLFFIGHSIGSTVGVMTGSLKEEYNSKITAHIALAPLIYTVHSMSLAHRLMVMSVLTLSHSKQFNRLYNVMPRRAMFSELLQKLFSDGQPLQATFLSILFLVVGEDYDQFNTTYITDILTYYPSGTSRYIMEQSFLFYWTGHLVPYDYKNKTLNLQKYNQTVPKPYNLSKVTHPIHLVYGKGDDIITKEDMDFAGKILPNTKKVQVPYDHFNHMDFMWAVDGKILLYDKFMELMNKYK